MARRDWTRDELILAMDLYCQLPFGKLHKGNPEVRRLSETIGRTASSVAMKLCNLASLDPGHKARGVKGLSGASQADREIWAEFHADWNRLVIEAARLMASKRMAGDEADESEPSFDGETESRRMTIVRLAQRFFRRAVLASYESKCCVTGIEQPDLLIASHIVPWSHSAAHRANPRNGLCLSRLHDGAFDKGLITLDEEFRLVVSHELRDHCGHKVLKTCFLAFEGKPIEQPSRFRPDTSLLQIHRDVVFRG